MIFQHPYGAPARPRDTGAVWESAYNPRKDLGWGMVCIVAFLGIVLAFAAMTPGA